MGFAIKTENSLMQKCTKMISYFLLNKLRKYVLFHLFETSADC